MPNIRMLTAQRELIEKEKLKHQGNIKARRSQETDTQDVAKKTNTDESARTAKKASRDAQVASAEIKLADKKAANAAIGAAIGAAGALVAVGVAIYKAAGGGESKQDKADNAQSKANSSQKTANKDKDTAKKDKTAAQEARKEAKAAKDSGKPDADKLEAKAKKLEDKADKSENKAKESQATATKDQDKATELQGEADKENAGDIKKLEDKANGLKEGDPKKDKLLAEAGEIKQAGAANREDAAKNRSDAGLTTPAPTPGSVPGQNPPQQQGLPPGQNPPPTTPGVPATGAQPQTTPGLPPGQPEVQQQGLPPGQTPKPATPGVPESVVQPATTPGTPPGQPVVAQQGLPPGQTPKPATPGVPESVVQPAVTPGAVPGQPVVAQQGATQGQTLKPATPGTAPGQPAIQQQGLPPGQTPKPVTPGVPESVTQPATTPGTAPGQPVVQQQGTPEGQTLKPTVPGVPVSVTQPATTPGVAPGQKVESQPGVPQGQTQATPTPGVPGTVTQPAVTPGTSPGQPVVTQPGVPQGQTLPPTIPGVPGGVTQPAATPGTPPGQKPEPKNALDKAIEAKANSRNSDGKGRTQADIAKSQAFNELFSALRELSGHGSDPDFKINVNYAKGAERSKGAIDGFQKAGQNISDSFSDLKTGKTSKDPTSAVAIRERARNFAEGKDQGSRSEAQAAVEKARGSGQGTIGKLEANSAIAKLEGATPGTPPGQVATTPPGTTTGQTPPQTVPGVPATVTQPAPVPGTPPGQQVQPQPGLPTSQTPQPVTPGVPGSVTQPAVTPGTPPGQPVAAQQGATQGQTLQPAVTPGVPPGQTPQPAIAGVPATVTQPATTPGTAPGQAPITQPGVPTGQVAQVSPGVPGSVTQPVVAPGTPPGQTPPPVTPGVPASVTPPPATPGLQLGLTPKEIKSLEDAGVKFTKDASGNITGFDKDSLTTAKKNTSLNDSDRSFLTRNGISATDVNENGTIKDPAKSKAALESAQKEVANAIVDQANAIGFRDGPVAKALFLAENAPEKLKAEDKKLLTDNLNVKFDAAGNVDKASLAKGREIYNFVTDPSTAYNAKGGANSRGNKVELTSEQANRAQGLGLALPAGSPAKEGQFVLDAAKIDAINQKGPGTAEKNSGPGKAGIRTIGANLLGALGTFLRVDKDLLSKAKENAEEKDSISSKKGNGNDYAKDIKDPGEKQRFLDNLNASGGDADKLIDRASLKVNRAKGGPNVEGSKAVQEAKQALNDARGHQGEISDKAGRADAIKQDLRDNIDDAFGPGKGDSYIKNYFDFDKEGNLSLKKGNDSDGFFSKVGSSIAETAREAFSSGSDSNIVKDIKEGKINNQDAAKLINALNNSGQGSTAAKILEGVGSDKAAVILNTKDQSDAQKKTTGILNSISTPDGKIDFGKLSALPEDDKKNALRALLGDGFEKSISGSPELTKALDPVLTDGKLDTAKLADLKTKDPDAFKRIEATLTGGGTFDKALNNAKDNVSGNIVSNDAVRSILNSGGISAGLAKLIGDKAAKGVYEDSSGNKTAIKDKFGNAIDGGRNAKEDLENQIGGAKVRGEKASSFNTTLLLFNVGVPALQFFLQQLDKLREAHEQRLEAQRKLDAANILLAKLGKELRRTQGSINGNPAEAPPK